MSIATQAAEASQTNKSAKSDLAAISVPLGMETTMPIKDQGFRLGDAIVLVRSDGSLLIERSSFLLALKGTLRPEALKDIEAKLPGAAHLELSSLTAAGIKCSYNSSDLELQVEPRVEQRPRGEITGSTQQAQLPADTPSPAIISGYLNVGAGLGYGRGNGNGDSFELPALRLDGALRFGGLVVEGEADLNPDGSYTRQWTRLVYDLPDEALRLSAGDLRLRPTGSLATPPLLGVAVEKTYATLQPWRNTRPTGKRSFRVERASDVKVLVNGSEVRRLQLSPGEYDLADLPLASGNNRVQLLIKDQFGKEEVIDYSILFNRTLLDPGLNEWSVAAGVKSPSSGSLDVDEPEDLMVTTAYRTGLSSHLTAGLSFMGSSEEALLGGSALLQTSLGLLSFDGSVSASAAGQLGWSAGVELNIERERARPLFESAVLGLDLVSDGYADGAGGASENASTIRISGSASRSFGYGVSGNLSGFYQLAMGEDNDAFGGNVGLTRALSSDLSLGFFAQYQHQGNDYAAGAYGEQDDLTLLGRLVYRPTATSDISLQYDSEMRRVTGNIGASSNHGAAAVGINVDVEHSPKQPGREIEHLVGGDIHYADSRIEASLSHDRHVERLGTETLGHQTTLSVGSAIAFADDKVAFGRPVRGAFAIVEPHASLSQSDVRVQPYREYYKASSDGLGALLISDLSAYSLNSISYDVNDLPPGYDVGSGAFQIVAPYKAGYGLTIGSDFSVTAIGTLKDERGEAIALKAAAVSSSQYPEKKLDTFTNNAGRFIAQGLKPGEWTITVGGKTFPFVIPEDAVGIVEIGEVAVHP